MRVPKETNLNRRRFLRTAAMTVAAAQFGTIACAKSQPPGSVRLEDEGKVPSLDGATAWLNSQPLSAASLRGKVVLFHVWTYTCINSLRTLPYVRAWAHKYKDQGLVVVGIHSPEFSFEQNLDNVRWATNAFRIDFPNAVDSNHAVWRAFNNEYWPAFYFADAKGRIRHHQFGENEYEQSERVIQQLLADAGSSAVPHDFSAVDARGLEVGADWADLKSPESYLGYGQAQNFSSPGGAHTNKSHLYAAPTRLGLNHWALTGDWTVGKEAVSLNQPNGRIAYRFHARDLHLVLGPAKQGVPIRFRVLIDGAPAGAAHGADIDEQGNGAVIEQRLYQLIRQPGVIMDRLFEIEFLDSGVEALDFTFGLSFAGTI